MISMLFDTVLKNDAEQYTINRERYHQNILALSKTLPAISQFYAHFCPKNIQLVLDNEQHLNLKNKAGFIYPNNPQANSHKQVDLYFEAPIHFQYTPYDGGKIEDKAKFLHQFHIMRIHNYFVENKKYAESAQALHQYIPTFIMLGIGLGYHLEKIFNEHDIDALFIYEPNEDIFYWALHIINFAPILEHFSETGRSISIEIGEESGQFINNIKKISNDLGYHLATRIYLYRHYNTKEIDAIFSRINQVIHRTFQGGGFFEDELISISHTLYNIKNNPNILIKNKKKILTPDRPAMIIGNGPSLDKEIEYIKENQNNYVIFSCGSALKALYKAGIIPDFQVEIERTKIVYDWIKDIKDDEYLKKIILVGINALYPHSADFFSSFYWGLKKGDAGTNLIYKTYGKDYFASFIHTNPTVVNGAFAIASYFNFSEVMLFAVDMGFKDPLHHHSKYSAYYEKSGEFYKEKEKIQMRVPGNFEKEVFTTLELEHSRFTLETQLKENENIKCFNTSDGAKIESSISKRSSDLKINSYLSNKKKLIKETINNSSDKITEENKNRINHFDSYFLSSVNGLIKQLSIAIEESIKNPPKSRKKLSEFFHKQYQLIRNMSNGDIDQMLHMLFNGTVIDMHVTLFSHLVDITDEKVFNALYLKSSEFFSEYLADIKEIAEKRFQTLNDDMSYVKTMQEKYQLQAVI